MLTPAYVRCCPDSKSLSSTFIVLRLEINLVLETNFFISIRIFVSLQYEHNDCSILPLALFSPFHTVVSAPHPMLLSPLVYFQNHNDVTSTATPLCESHDWLLRNKQVGVIPSCLLPTIHNLLNLMHFQSDLFQSLIL